MIVISDFDNTLYPQGSPETFLENLQAVQHFRQSGHKFCLASGRNVSSIKRIWPEYQNYLDYAILDNGAVCTNSHGDPLFQETIPQDLARSIYQDITSVFRNQVTFVYYREDRELPEISGDLTKLRCWSTNQDIGDQILRKINNLYSKEVKGFLAKNATMSSINWIRDAENWHSFVDIMAIKAGKENAISKLCAQYFPNQKIITIGDDTNDLGMLQAFDGYAMKSSFPEVLAAIKPSHRIVTVSELLNRLLD